MTVTAPAPPRTVEIVEFPGSTMRAAGALRAMAASAQAFVVTRGQAYVGGSDWLLFWGPGGADRKAAMVKQAKAGGHSIAMDLAYYDRLRKVRFSIDAAHPQAWVMRRDWPASRFRADGIVLQDRWTADGPVIVAGIGRKAREQYGAAVPTWEANMISACRAKGWDVRYRRKQGDAPVPAGVPLTSDAPIDDVLVGASAVITWHSNVAVDAIRLGIPVVCRDGAAAAICPADLPEAWAPIPVEIRRRFFQNLSYFQWALPAEATSCWAWLQEILA